MNFARMIFLVLAVQWCALANACEGKKQECMGYASIDAGGVIHLNLFSKDETHGGAMLVFDKQNSLYAELRKHIGKVRVGQWKCLKVMPEAPGPGTPAKGLIVPTSEASGA